MTQAHEVYDLAADRWSAANPMPTARDHLAAATLAARILVFGGEAPLRIFAKAPMPTPRHGIGAAVIAGRVYIPGGGRQPGFAATSVNEAYTP